MTGEKTHLINRPAIRAKGDGDILTSHLPGGNSVLFAFCQIHSTTFGRVTNVPKIVPNRTCWSFRPRRTRNTVGIVIRAVIRLGSHCTYLHRDNVASST